MSGNGHGGKTSLDLGAKEHFSEEANLQISSPHTMSISYSSSVISTEGVLFSYYLIYREQMEEDTATSRGKETKRHFSRSGEGELPGTCSYIGYVKTVPRIRSKQELETELGKKPE